MFFPNIAAERARRRMSVDEFAEKLGVTRRTIYNWETQGKIPMDAMAKMADLFNCTIDYLAEVIE